MSSIKCKHCGLTNFSSHEECKRCHEPLFSAAPKRSSEKTPRSFSLSSVLFIAVAVAVVYYFYSGIGNSVKEVNAIDANRVAVQKPGDGQGLSRTEYDKQRSGSFGSAVKNSSSLAASDKHVEDTQKMMQQASNSR